MHFYMSQLNFDVVATYCTLQLKIKNYRKKDEKENKEEDESALDLFFFP